VQMDLKRIKLHAKPPVIELVKNIKENFGVESRYKPFFEFETLPASYEIWNNEPPVYTITDSKATVIARYRKDGHAAIAWKSLDNWNSVFCSLPLQNPVIMRMLFKKAGCHVYNESGDVIHVGGGLLVVHTKTGGERNIALRNGKKIHISLRPNSTVIFDNETGEVLLN